MNSGLMTDSIAGATSHCELTATLRFGVIISVLASEETKSPAEQHLNSRLCVNSWCVAVHVKSHLKMKKKIKTS